jgi:uncharacterized RDD family membrane protein YckC
MVCNYLLNVKNCKYQTINFLDFNIRFLRHSIKSVIFFTVLVLNVIKKMFFIIFLNIERLVLIIKNLYLILDLNILSC